MWRVRFWKVGGEEMNANGGFIEVADDGTVTMTAHMSFIADLRAPVDPRDMASASTRPAGGFERIGDAGDQVVVEAVGEWDPEAWIDKVRYHFRVSYLRPGEVAIDAEPEQGGVGVATDRSSGLLGLHVDVEQPNDDWVNPVDYWLATGEGWENIPSDEQVKLRQWLGVANGPVSTDDGRPGAETE
jgi:hypothetical protein